MEPYIGEVILFAGNFEPRGWKFCDGQLLPIAQNDALFSILGTTYGGDGKTTFALPDLRGRVPLGPRDGPGLSDYTLGEAGGAEDITITDQTMPMHMHSLHGLATTASQQNPQGRMLVTPGDAIYAEIVSTEDRTMATASVGYAGGSQPHQNVQPFIAVNYIIAIYGVYPSRN